MLPLGRTFYKMSGSGNDFIFVDATIESAARLTDPEVVQALCSRGTGIGADGLVLLENSARAAYRMIYLNSDGSRPELCGNASLCSARLATELGLVTHSTFSFESERGLLTARFTDDGPEIDLETVHEVRLDLPFRLTAGERWIGYAHAGVPHVVVRVSDVSAVDVAARGRIIRNDPWFPHGANVNFVSRHASGIWRIRTYERGIEAETLACGTGAVACCVVLSAKDELNDRIQLITRSGRTLRVRLERTETGWKPSLAGEARIVFVGQFCEL